MSNLFKRDFEIYFESIDYNYQRVYDILKKNNFKFIKNLFNFIIYLIVYISLQKILIRMNIFYIVCQV